MKREQISLGTKEQKRAFVLNQLLSWVVAVDEAAQSRQLMVAERPPLQLAQRGRCVTVG